MEADCGSRVGKAGKISALDWKALLFPGHQAILIDLDPFGREPVSQENAARGPAGGANVSG